MSAIDPHNPNWTVLTCACGKKRSYTPKEAARWKGREYRCHGCVIRTGRDLASARARSAQVRRSRVAERDAIRHVAWCIEQGMTPHQVMVSVDSPAAHPRATWMEAVAAVHAAGVAIKEGGGA